MEERHNDDHNIELEKEVVDASPEQPAMIVPEPYNDDDDASIKLDVGPSSSLDQRQSLNKSTLQNLC